MVYSGQLLSPHTVNRLSQTADTALFEAGVTSAPTRKDKYNTQYTLSGALFADVARELMRNGLFLEAACPRRIARLALVRYATGDGYGPHVDAGVQEGVPVDVSFTIGVNPLSGYRGGLLSISGVGSQTVAPGKGVVYPATMIHEVTPVTHGHRTVLVGWAESHYKTIEARQCGAIVHRLSRATQGGPLENDVAQLSILLRRLL
jgi:PKHD-type hydroxylase